MEHNKKITEKAILKEDLIKKFIDSFFDAYKRGLQSQFINKTRERNPSLASSLENVIVNLDKAREVLRNKKAISK